MTPFVSAALAGLLVYVLGCVDGNRKQREHDRTVEILRHKHHLHVRLKRHRPPEGMYVELWCDRLHRFACKIGLHVMAPDFMRDAYRCPCGYNMLTYEQIYRSGYS